MNTKHNLIEKYFSLVILLVALLALWQPRFFVWAKPHIPMMLGIIMFGMGVTLKFSDFIEIWRHRGLVLAGVALQYTAMPLLAVIISLVLGLPKEAMIGMVIVGSCPGGTASNVLSYLARADVALSVTLTLCSTLLAPILTPFIIYLILSHKVEVSFLGMVQSIFWIVFFPLLAGLVLRHFFYNRIARLLSWFPTLSILMIGLVIGCVIALNSATLLTFPALTILAVILHNSLGLAVGYSAGRLFKTSSARTHTLAFEIGMQNSGLGVSLAAQFFTAAAALPGAIFSVIHNLTGVLLAKWWSIQAEKKIRE